MQKPERRLDLPGVNLAPGGEHRYPHPDGLLGHLALIHHDLRRRRKGAQGGR